MKLLIVPGDGIGPEITAATLQAVERLQERFGLRIEREYADSGSAALEKHGVTVREEDIARARAADGVILGPMSVSHYPPVAEGGVNVPAQYRTRLDLYANIRPSYTRAGVPSVARAMDLVIVRENREDFYADRNMHLGSGEMMPTPGMALAIGKITAEGTRRAAKVAFDLARRRRRKVTIVHKRPVLKLYHGLFLDEAMAVADDYADVETDALHVDAVAALLIRTPERFDVLLMPNMYGDILSEEAAELAGSLGLASSLNYGDECLVAQAGHGSAPDIAGQDVANPSSLMDSVAMLFESHGVRAGDDAYIEAGHALRRSVDETLASVETRTRDLGGPLGTRAFADRVAARLARS